MGSLIVEDDDPRISYSDGWSQIAGDDSSGHSMHLTREIGSSASFSFNGIKVSVFGGFGPPDKEKGFPTSTYTIDGASSAMFTPPNSTTQQIDGQRFFESPTLPQGNHTLKIQLVQGDWFWFDNLVIAPGSQPSSTSAASLSSLTASPAGSLTTENEPSIGPIVGGVVGGALFLALLFAALFYFLYRRRKAASSGFVNKPFVDRREVFTGPQPALSNLSVFSKQSTFHGKVSSKSNISIVNRRDEERPPPEYSV